MIAIIDYDAGNIKSVIRALERLGETPVLSNDPDVLLSADGIILPGVGAFGDCMEKLEKYNLVECINGCVEKNIPFLGICLGMQLLFESSEESKGVKGLSLLPGKIVRIPDGDNIKVPHVGWNDLSFPNEGRLFKGINPGSYVYFVHSYYLQCDDFKLVKATCDYGVNIHAAVEKGNIFGCQFHPEKSSDVGLKILKNFVEIVNGEN